MRTPNATWLLTVAAVLSAAMTGCTGADEAPKFEEDTVAATDEDAGLVVDSGAEDDAGAIATDAGEAATDAGASAPDASLDCPGAPGCVCKENAECDSSFCIQTPDGKRRAQTCVERVRPTSPAPPHRARTPCKSAFPGT